jgi:hypothetical protein
MELGVTTGMECYWAAEHIPKNVKVVQGLGHVSISDSALSEYVCDC